MRELLKDMRRAARALGKNPWLSGAAVLTLSLGLGAVGAMVSVVKGVILRPLPYADSEQLVMIWNSWKDFSKTWVSVPEFRLYREQQLVFEDMALFDTDSANLMGQGGPERVGVGRVSANLFKVVGSEPVLGRSFHWEENQEGKGNVVILSHGLWQRRFAGSRDVLGSAIELNGSPSVIVGVMPEGFKLPLDFNSATPSQLWIPLKMDMGGAVTVPRQGGEHNYFAIARLRPGVSAVKAGTSLAAVGGRLTAEGVYPEDWHFRPLAIPLLDDVLGATRGALLILLATVALVLLIACANVTLLLLARGNQRRRELAIRAALGASRGQLVRQILAESLVLAFLSGGVGLVLAFVGLRQIVTYAAASVPRIGEVSLDGGVIAVLAVITLGTALLTGLLPARHHSLIDPQPVLKEGGRSPSGLGRRSSQNALIAVEMALAVVLVIGTSLLMRSFWKLSHVDVGFRAADVLTLELAPSGLDENEGERVARYYEDLLGRIRQVPGVEAVAAVRALPIASEMGDWGLQVEGYVTAPGERLKGDWQAVTPGYFEVMGIPLEKGRLFTQADRLGAQPVIVVNGAMARKFWPNQDPIGKRVRVLGTESSPWSSVVGVVGDVRHNGITADVKEQWYLPQAQFHVSTGFSPKTMTLVIKPSMSPDRLVPALRAAFLAYDPKLPASNVQTLNEVLAKSMSQPRLTLSLMTICALIALVLAVVGTYGVIAYSVSQRTQELGLRLALGAQPNRVVAMVVAQGMTIAGVGILAGGIAALVASRALAGLLYGIKTFDPVSFLAAIGLLAIVSCGAMLLPARRVAKIDPLEALREN